MSEPTRQEVFVASGFFALRTPLLPFDELRSWGEGLGAASAGDELTALETACAADWERLRKRLREVYARPDVREALFVASPGLEERIGVWQHGPDTEAGRKIERALVRYFLRMAGRATPFGLFAGCSVGTIADPSQIVLAPRARYRRHTRLDMDYLVLLTDALARRPEVRRKLVFEVNSSLYATHGRFRYAEVRRDGQGWTHHQVALEASDYLEATLARAAKGSPPAALEDALLALDSEASREEAEEYIISLVENQVLVSELRPTVTGPEPIAGLAARLGERARSSDAENGSEMQTPVADRLEEVRRELADLDEAGLGIDPAPYRRIARSLEALPTEIELGRLFQVDMVKPVEVACLGSAVLNEMIAGVRLLHRLTHRPRDDRLGRFREAFIQRYEGREVPLVEALDAESGIGFDTIDTGSTDASSLLDDLKFPEPAKENFSWGKREKHLLNLLGAAIASGAAQLDLTPHDVEALASSAPLPLPDAFALMASIAAPSERALSEGDFQVLLEGVSGPSGARLLGRFCHADPELCKFVEQHVQAEEAMEPDALFAEVVHLPEGRLGNILARPILRAFEIPYLGAASVYAEHQIPVTDLRVSVVNGQIVLRSDRLGKRVIPRLTSAHNFHLSQGIYRFLCALQSQGTIGELGWSWGPLNDAPFLPRVVHGRLVLSRAYWRISEPEIKFLAKPIGAARFRAVQQWRSSRRMPQWVALVDADNELPIDLQNVVAVDTLVELIKARDQAALVELFPSPDKLWVQGPEGRFVHELIVPFVLDKETRRQGDKGTRRQGDKETHKDCVPRSISVAGCLRVSSSARCFPPGSEWLYAKLYTGPAMLDQVLRDVVRPVVESVTRAGAADRWFFIRYGDPDWHLRLRFHGEPARLQHDVLLVLQAATAPLLADGRLWRLQLDTYEREVERYGGPVGIELAERLFQADSEAVLALAEFFSGDARGDLRWRVALRGMDLLLADLEFDLGSRHDVIREARESFGKEFALDAPFKHQLAAKYRKERPRLEVFFRMRPGEMESPDPCADILRQRSASLRQVVCELKSQAKDGRLSLPLTALAPSYLHMHANRLLRSAHRAQELVLYDFLTRWYESQGARLPKRH
jgi:thiopeptide-type bacteriocin biosynthesis protein